MSSINERFGISLGERYDIHKLKTYKHSTLLRLAKKSPEVLIWNNRYEAYWRPNGCGYTKDSAQAGIFGFTAAYAATMHVDKTHRIELVTINFATEKKEEQK